MTLPASGTITGADIRNELKQSGGNLVFPDDTTRWLSGVSSGPLVLPTNFYSKRAVKQTWSAHVTGASASLSSTFQLGIDFPGRYIVICVAAIATSTASQVLINSVTLNGNVFPLGPGQAWFNAGVNIASGIASGTISGTSATLAVNCNQSIQAFVAVLYVLSNPVSIVQQNQQGSASANTAFTTVNVTAGVGGGVVIVSCLKASGTGQTMAFSGATSDFQLDIAGGCRYGTAVINRLPTESNHGCGVNVGGAANICTIAAMSFS